MAWQYSSLNKGNSLLSLVDIFSTLKKEFYPVDLLKHLHQSTRNKTFKWQHLSKSFKTLEPQTFVLCHPSPSCTSPPFSTVNHPIKVKWQKGGGSQINIRLFRKWQYLPNALLARNCKPSTGTEQNVSIELKALEAMPTFYQMKIHLYRCRCPYCKLKRIKAYTTSHLVNTGKR